MQCAELTQSHKPQGTKSIPSTAEYPANIQHMVEIPGGKTTEMQVKCRRLIAIVCPRLRSNRDGMKFDDPIFAGELFEDFEVGTVEWLDTQTTMYMPLSYKY